MPKQTKKTATKKKLKDKSQTDGKDYTKPMPKSLEEIWGSQGSKFGTTDEETYKKKLSLMNKADLQSACIKIGLVPHDNRQIMVDRLIKQFRQHVGAIQTRGLQQKPVPNNQNLRSMMAALGGNTLV